MQVVIESNVRNNLLHELGNLLMILLGSVILASGVTCFLQPNLITSGGTPGMAILLSYLSDFSTGTIIIMINIPLLILGYYYLGKGFVWRTIAAVALISGFVDLFNEVVDAGAITSNPILAALYGGVAIGLGVGLVLRGNASAGGPTIIARILDSRTKLRSGQVIMAMDVIIVASSAIVFGALEPALLSFLSVVATGKSIDFVMDHVWSERWVVLRESLGRLVMAREHSLTARPE